MMRRRLFAFVAGMMMMTILNAQWREMQFDDSDMALDLAPQPHSDRVVLLQALSLNERQLLTHHRPPPPGDRPSA